MGSGQEAVKGRSRLMCLSFLQRFIKFELAYIFSEALRLQFIFLPAKISTKICL